MIRHNAMETDQHQHYNAVESVLRTSTIQAGQGGCALYNSSQVSLITGIIIEILFIHKKYFPLHSSEDATQFGLRKSQLLYNAKIYV